MAELRLFRFGGEIAPKIDLGRRINSQWPCASRSDSLDFEHSFGDSYHRLVAVSAANLSLFIGAASAVLRL